MDLVVSQSYLTPMYNIRIYIIHIKIVQVEYNKYMAQCWWSLPPTTSWYMELPPRPVVVVEGGL